MHLPPLVDNSAGVLNRVHLCWPQARVRWVLAAPWARTRWTYCCVWACRGSSRRACCRPRCAVGPSPWRRIVYLVAVCAWSPLWPCWMRSRPPAGSSYTGRSGARAWSDKRSSLVRCWSMARTPHRLEDSEQSSGSSYFVKPTWAKHNVRLFLTQFFLFNGFFFLMVSNHDREYFAALVLSHVFVSC